MRLTEGNPDAPTPRFPPGGPAARALGHRCMTSSELMFFLGAPLAHVVEYEDQLRTKRLATYRALRLAPPKLRTQRGSVSI